MLSASQLACFHDQGYLLIRSLLDAYEFGTHRKTAIADNALDDHSISMNDDEGGDVRLALWNHPGDSTYEMLARSERIVDAMEQLLEGNIYRYHSKLFASRRSSSVCR